MTILQLWIDVSQKTDGEGIEAATIGQLMFDLRDKGVLGLEDSMEVVINDPFEDGTHRGARVGFELSLAEFIPAILKLEEMDIHYVPPLTSVPKIKCEAYLNHEFVYRVREKPKS